VYASAGLNGRGDAYLLDCPVLSQIDADGNGSFERERKYLQNSRGDVIGVQELDVYTPDECIRYTVYGYPALIPQPDPYHSQFAVAAHIEFSRQVVGVGVAAKGGSTLSLARRKKLD
jgi:hypothetical protein